VLVVITPTGSGWIDPASMDTVEYLHNGDVASVAQQYSYLSSPLSLLFEPEYGSEAARALFAAVYEYWTTLPHDRRPKLYLHGLSLGAMNSERSVELFEILGDPVQGALWSGPADAPWGPMRIVYLQYASDAITFFDYRDFYRRPAWMDAPRGPDVSPELQWYPVVSMLQLALDMAVATTTPMGYGHVFAPEHYVDAWLAVTDPQGWSADRIARLKQHLAARGRM
jgi:uncharacterized membrane protein